MSEKKQQPVASPAVYVAMPVEVQYVVSIPVDSKGDGKPTPLTPTTTITPPRVNKRRLCGCICCTCCIWTIMAALLFMIIVPRTPVMFLDSLQINEQSQLVGAVKFKNDDIFDVKFQDPKLNMYWLTDEATVFGVDDPNDACDFWVFVGHACGHNYDMEMCALKIAHFEEDGSFSVSARQEHTESLDLTTDADDKAYFVEMLKQAASDGHSLLYSTGNVEARTSVRNFHTLHADDSLYCFE